MSFGSKSPEEIVTIAKQNNWSIEFSSGMPYREDMEAFYLNSSVKRMPHNYFPSPKTPFVLNLASSDSLILEKSIQHCKKLLQLAKKSASPFYAAHAGFCVDPIPSQLGKTIEYLPNFNKEINKQIFINSIRSLVEFAEEIDMIFLIENNVIAPFNLHEGVENPLLCCSGDDIKWLFDQIESKHFGLLLDTAHLKVSASTLQLNLDVELKKISPFIKALHHSDNDGKQDNNEPITKDYWFFPVLKEFNHLIQVIEVKNISEHKIKQQINILQDEFEC